MIVVRPERPEDRDAIHRLVAAAFGGAVEADLVDGLRADGDLLLSLVAAAGDGILGHAGFSRLIVRGDNGDFVAVALAPVAVLPEHQRVGIGSTLISAGHDLLRDAGEALSVVVGDPAYYARFGYRRDLAEGFESVWQCEALQALAFRDAPRTGRLVYAPAFERL